MKKFLKFLQGKQLFVSIRIAFARAWRTACDNQGLPKHTFKQTESIFRHLVEYAPDAIFVIDADSVITMMNEKAERMFCATRDVVIGTSIETLAPGLTAYGNLAREQGKGVIQPQKRFKTLCRRGQKESFSAEISLGSLLADGKELSIALVRDLAGHNRAADDKKHLIALLEATPDFIGFMDTQQRALYLNRAGRSMVGLNEKSDITKLALEDCMPAWAIQTIRELGAPIAQRNGHWVGETALLGQNGEEIPVSQVVVCHKDTEGNPAYWSTICRDISGHKNFEAVLLDQIMHDALTGLPNRMSFNQKLHRAISQEEATKQLLAVVVLGLDYFKNVNDTFGRACGDELLQAVAGRLHAELRQGDTLARQGGDEFIVLMREAQNAQQVQAEVVRLLDCMSKPFYIAGREIFVAASMGISLFPEDQQHAEGLLHNAEMALNNAKKEGRNCYRFHTVEMGRRIQERLELESSLHYAVECGQFFLHYQPRVMLPTGKMVGVEALLRWRHPVLGLIPPNRFIPVAEESGLIEKIGMWVLETACIQAHAWQKRGLPRLRVSVNLSARQFGQANLVDSVQAILEKIGLDPACLELEITESTVMHDTGSAIKTLRALKKLGVALSIDDFGTGYSSLSYLKLFPIDVLKIDRSFIKDVICDPNDAAITRAIVALAQSLDLDVVAEGVETAEQAAFLEACGCNEIQGFFISKPIDGDALALMLNGQAENNMQALDETSSHLVFHSPLKLAEPRTEISERAECRRTLRQA